MDVPLKTGVISVKSLGKVSNGFSILENITFTIREGEMIGVVGPNGAGKSTLANIILGFDHDYTGEVEIDSAVRMAYVPQHTKLDAYVFPLSVKEFMRSAANRYYNSNELADIERLLEMLRHVGLTDRQLSQNIYSLSGGQLQRVLIARALMSEPTFLLLDEPLAAVDCSARDSLYQLLRHLNQQHNITMLVISHDVESITAISDSVLCLNQTLHYGCHPSDFVSGSVKTKSLHQHRQSH